MNGVKIKKLDVKKDSRGWVAEIVRAEDLENRDKKFGQIYVSTAKPGQTKGGHYHERKTEWFCVIKGKGLLTLVDKKSGKSKKIKMGEDNMVAVQIPPFIWHAIANRAKNEMYLLAYTTEQYNARDPDTIYEQRT